MRLSNDLKEFLESLNSRGVDYVIVGAHSLAFHGRPRYTGDLDILVRATSIPSRDALIQNKRAVGRPQNLADLETLED